MNKIFLWVFVALLVGAGIGFTYASNSKTFKGSIGGLSNTNIPVIQKTSFDPDRKLNNGETRMSFNVYASAKSPLNLKKLIFSFNANFVDVDSLQLVKINDRPQDITDNVTITNAGGQSVEAGGQSLSNSRAQNYTDKVIITFANPDVIPTNTSARYELRATVTSARALSSMRFTAARLNDGGEVGDTVWDFSF